MKRATILLALLLTIAGALSGTASAADAAPAAAERLQSLDRAILFQLNAARVSRGLRPLALSSELEEAAVAHSLSMLEGGFFAHDSRDGSPFVARVKRYYPASGFQTWSAGENLLYNTAAIDAETAIEAWLDSPAHRENMLDPSWREVGIGSLHATSAGGQFGGDATWVITMDFGARTGGKAEQRDVSSSKGAPAAASEKGKARKARKATKAAADARRLKAAKAARAATAEKAATPEKAAKSKARTAAKPTRPEGHPVDRVLPLPSAGGEAEDRRDGAADDLGDEADDLSDDLGDDESGDAEADDDEVPLAP